MEITIQNKFLSLTVDTLGAQMLSLRSSDGCQYLWQGDPAYWADRAPTLFPMIGRLYDCKYRVQDKEYTLGIHGFAAGSEFSVAERSYSHLILKLESNLETLSQYPFDFVFEVVYTLHGSTVEVSYRVHNQGAETLDFAVGGHPGFRVPLLDGESFEDYTLEFSKACQPDRICFSPQLLVNGQTEPYLLEDDRRIRLGHKLFDEDAIILQNMDRQVTLSAGNGRSVCVSFPDMPYVGFWHWPQTDAPYVCIEPWSSLPGRQDVVEDLSCRSDLIHLRPDDRYINTWSITIQ